MEHIKWLEASKNDNGLYMVAINDLGDVVGYNNILKGDAVIFLGKKYTVVMVSRLGDFGLSETENLPYIMRANPSSVVKA